MIGGTKSSTIRTAALNYNINVSVTAGEDVGHIIKFWLGQCHHDFVVFVALAAVLVMEDTPFKGP